MAKKVVIVKLGSPEEAAHVPFGATVIGIFPGPGEVALEADEEAVISGRAMSLETYRATLRATKA